MANEEHLSILRQGVAAWNEWRKTNSTIVIPFSRDDLSYADLSNCDLSRVDFREANLIGANLCGAKLSGADLIRAVLLGADIQNADLDAANLDQANLMEANLTGAKLTAELKDSMLIRAILKGSVLKGANLCGANLTHADLSNADLRGAYLIGTNFLNANLSGADLTGAILTGAILVGTDLRGAKLNNCKVYGISAWDLKVDDATDQKNLIITPPGQSEITVDNLKVAQFIYLLLNNPEIRDVIDTITSKVVLILGRFTSERKVILDAIRDELRRRNYSPVIFDFTVPGSRDTDETVNLLARMARFVIADATDAKSLPQELKGIVEPLPSVPVQPIILSAQHEWGMFDHIKRYPWVLPTYQYEGQEQLIAALPEKVIAPAEAKVKELRG